MSTLTIQQEQARRVVADLTALGEKLEAENNPLWIKAARAAATLEGMRLGIATMEPFDNVTGGLTQ